MTGTLGNEQYSLFIISRSILLRMKIFQTNAVETNHIFYVQ